MKWILRIAQALVVMAVLGLMGIVLVSDYLGPDKDTLEKVEEQRELLRMQTAAKRREIQRLGQELEGLQRNPQVLEHGIREDLGYVRSDEKVLELPVEKPVSSSAPRAVHDKPGNRLPQ